MAMRPDRERIEGGLLGVAVGDALGWPMEDRGNRVGGTANIEPDWDLVSWRRREGGGYGPHEQAVDAGSVSDDTQLTLAVARSVLHRDQWLDYWTRVELPLWTVYERGGGGATKRAAQTWLRGHSPWDEAEKQKAVGRYFSAGGNGAAMRCLAHCVVADNWEDLAYRLDLDGATTHGHPRALLGSRVYGWAAQHGLLRRSRLRYGELLDRVLDAEPEWGTFPRLPDAWHAAAQRAAGGYEDAWHRTVGEVRQGLEIARAGIREGAVAVDQPVLEDLGAFSQVSGAGTVSAVASIFLATRYLSQPQQGLIAAAFARGADTDTLAAMTGGLLGLLLGNEWLWPLASRVQDFEYTRELARPLELRRQAEPIDWRFTARERTRLYRWLDKALPGADAELPPFGRIRLTDVEDYPARTQFVRAWALETQLGQSFLIKRYDKGRDGQPRWVPIARPEEGADRGAPAHDPSSRVEPRVGLVLRVSDVNRAKAFYTEVVGLSVRRATERFISFGWLALEPDERAGQLSLESSDDAPMPAIRLYVGADEVERMRERFKEFGLNTTLLENQPHAGFRSRDPDGHSIEVVARNGAPTP
jgi:ADP-ribosylglycohydrolase/catechol 2,3-dioxygenase-like lactoylglutathione lyase family enzyme